MPKQSGKCLVDGGKCVGTTCQTCQVEHRLDRSGDNSGLKSPREGNPLFLGEARPDLTFYDSLQPGVSNTEGSR